MTAHRWTIAAVSMPIFVLLLLMPHWFRHLDPLTGDEPFYVMTAMSMWNDHDLNEANNYENRDYDSFYPAQPLPGNWQGWPSFPRDLPPHPAQTERDGLYTKHGLGLSILIALPWRLLERVGAVLTIITFAALSSWGMFTVARRSGASPQIAWATAVGLALSLPMLPYSLLLFPEVPGAAAMVVAVLAISDRRPSRSLALGGGLALGLLPWLHQRFLLTVLALGIVVVVDRGLAREWRALLLTAVPAVLGSAGIATYNWWLYGQFTQNTADHAGFHGGSAFLNAGAGLLLDAQWGLFVAAPITIVALAATPMWIREQPRLAFVAAAGVLPYIALVEAYRVWWGEWGPPARYLVPIIPLAAGPLALLLQKSRKRGRALVVAGFAIGLLPLIAGLTHPQRLYHHPDGVNRLWSTVGDRVGIPLERVLVAFQPYAVDSVGARSTATVVAALLIVGAWWLIRHTVGPSTRS